MKIEYATLWDIESNETAHDAFQNVQLEGIDRAVEDDMQDVFENSGIAVSREDYRVAVEVTMTVEEYKEFLKNNS